MGSNRSEGSPWAGIVGGSIAVLASALALLALRPNSSIARLILVLPVLGGVVALIWPRRRLALLVGVLLILTGMSFLLISGVGLVYLPAVALLLSGMRTPRSRSAPEES